MVTCFFDLRLHNLISDIPRFDLPYCDNATSNAEQVTRKETCERNREVILALYEQHTDMMNQMRSAIQHIYYLLPTEQQDNREFGRKKSLLPIGGVILGELFGTASEADLANLKQW